MRKIALLFAVALAIIVGCSTPKPAKACNNFIGGGFVGGGSFDQFGNPIGANFAFNPAFGFNSFSSYSSPAFIGHSGFINNGFAFNAAIGPSFVNVNPRFVGFRSFNSFNPSFGFNAAVPVLNARGGLLGSRIFAGNVGVGVNFSPNVFFNASFNPAFGFNQAFARGRFGAIRPLAVSGNGALGVRGPLGGFHPFRANGRPTLLPRRL